MRVALVAHGLPPHARTGVETHTAALAAALGRAGHSVEAFAPRHVEGLAHFAARREERRGWAVTWVNAPKAPAGANDAEMRAAFARFLDRERPEVVHFQHLLRLGLGVVEEASERGLPTVYTAHDFYPVHDAYTLVRPDLTTFAVGDGDAEALGIVAGRFLDGLAKLGDHHGAVLREQLDEEEARTLAAILSGTAVPGVVEAETLESARREHRERAERKRAAFASFDARFATSRYLAKTLSANLGRAVDWRAAGIEIGSRFQGLEGPKRTDGRVRFGFLGAILKHKGVHVLLDALERLDSAVEVHVFGDSGDRDYVGRMRERANALGAHWHGRYRSSDVSAALACFDVLVVPSIWSENAPFVIREAFAARRPVIAARTEALAESVQEDADGLLFDPGDAGSLAATMRRFVDEEWLLDRMEMGVAPVKDVDAEAAEWAATYQDLATKHARRRSAPDVPAHLTGFVERYRKLDGLPTRALFAGVVKGLGVLGERMGLGSSTNDFMTLAIARGSRLGDGVVEDARAIDWLQRSVEGHEEARDELERRCAWYESQLDDLRGQVSWHEGQAKGRDEELDSLREVHEHLTRERDWLRESQHAGEAALEELQGRLDEAASTIESLTEERAWLRECLDEGATELRRLREALVGAGGPDDANHGEAIERHFRDLEEELAAMRKHEAWLRGEVKELVVALSDDLDVGATLEPGRVAEALESGHDGLERIVAELSWRRDEMAEARKASESIVARIAGGGLAARVRGWTERGEDPS